MRCAGLAVAAFISGTTIAAAGEPHALSREEAAARFGPAIAKAEAAADAFRDRLFARLNELLVQAGPVQAIRLCRSEAPAIAKEVGERQGVRIGRTARRLRNPANAPPRWASAHVAATTAKRAVGVTPAVFDLGDRIGVLRPITVMPACTRCHGAIEGLDADVRAELARAYPDDQAKQFEPGDLRGFFWVEVPKR